MPTESRLTIRLDQDIRDALRRKAEAEGKTVTDVIVSFIMEYLKEPADVSSQKTSMEGRVEQLEFLLDRSLGELPA